MLCRQVFYPPTRSTIVSPISRRAPTPSVTAACACCATCFATLVTRCIGDLRRGDDEERFELEDEDRLELEDERPDFDFFIVLRFAPDREVLLADLRAPAFFACPRFADFFAPRFAPPFLLEDRFELEVRGPERFFLAAMTNDSWIRELEPEVTCKKQARQSGQAIFFE
jgi:hypothetical protein